MYYIAVLVSANESSIDDEPEPNDLLWQDLEYKSDHQDTLQVIDEEVVADESESEDDQKASVEELEDAEVTED